MGGVGRNRGEWGCGRTSGVLGGGGVGVGGVRRNRGCGVWGVGVGGVGTNRGEVKKGVGKE